MPKAHFSSVPPSTLISHDLTLLTRIHTTPDHSDMELVGEFVVNGNNDRTALGKLHQSGLGVPPGELGSDRTYEYLLTEEKARQRLWRMRAGSALDASVSHTPRAGTPRATSPGFVAPQIQKHDVSTGCNLKLLGYDNIAQTFPILDIQEQDEKIAEQIEDINAVRARVQRLKTAILSKARHLREDLNHSRSDFLLSHEDMMAEEGDRRTFETASLLSLRALERERRKDAKRALTQASPNAYDTEIALLRMSVPENHLRGGTISPPPLREVFSGTP